MIHFMALCRRSGLDGPDSVETSRYIPIRYNPPFHYIRPFERPAQIDDHLMPFRVDLSALKQWPDNATSCKPDVLGISSVFQKAISGV